MRKLLDGSLVALCLLYYLGSLVAVTGCCEVVEDPTEAQRDYVGMLSKPFPQQPDVVTSEMLEDGKSPGKVDLNADVQWRQVTLIDRETCRVLETWITGEPVQYDSKEYVPFTKSDGLGCVIVEGHTLIEQLTDEVANEIKDDPAAQKKHAERNIIDLGLSQ